MSTTKVRNDTVTAIDFVSPIGHENFNTAVMKTFSVSHVICKRFYEFSSVKKLPFPGVQKQLGYQARVERLFLFPFWFVFFSKQILSSKRVIFLSFDFYSEPLLIGILSFFKDVYVIHHGVPDFEANLPGKLKLFLIRVFFRRVTNIVMVKTVSEIFRSLGLKKVELFQHPFTLDIKDVVKQEKQQRVVKFAMLSRSDAQYFQNFQEYRAKHGVSLRIRTDFRDDNIMVPVQILSVTKYFIFWELFETKVSGWVYDAIQCGCKIVMRRSGFADTVISQFPKSVLIVDSIEEVFELK